MTTWRGGPALDIAPQPYFAAVMRALEALRRAGQPLPAADEKRIAQLAETLGSESVGEAEGILDRHTLLAVRLDADGAGSAMLGRAPRELVEQGWRCFLVRIENPFALQAPIGATADGQMLDGELVQRMTSAPEPALGAMPAAVAGRWMGLKFFRGRPLGETLSGAAIEYRVLQAYSRDSGRRSAYLQVHAAAASWRTAFFRGERPLGVQAQFECLSSQDVRLSVKDWDGTGCTASLFINDLQGRIYPAPTHRLAPDFDFQPQVYRADNETLRLPVGQFTVESWRGPEYIRSRQALDVRRGSGNRLEVRLQRWINAAALGWYPGETHIHASGCSHYETPTVGVTPETVIRHVRGEALSVGSVLTWGPGYQHQKQFFSGRVYEPRNELEYPEFQAAAHVTLEPRPTPHDQDSLIRYDMEISGFPSSHSGHLVLLRLQRMDYPDAPRIEDWPSWHLPILQWAKAQRAVVGYTHCGLGLNVATQELPNYEIPRFDQMGANECLVDVTHEAVDVVSGVEATPVSELNFWYHLLNCGFRLSMLGETDFPCLTDDRVGMGRTYVGLARPPSGDAGYDEWIEGIRAGRLYFGEGRSHFIDYEVNGQGVGRGDVEVSRSGKVAVRARIAARLEEKPIDTAGLPLWHLERSRVGGTRTVPVEVVVNGESVATRIIVADGVLRDFSVEVPIERSSWVALRILYSGHTHPIFVRVGKQPVRASKRSARWCRSCVDRLWEVKSPFIRESERAAAAEAYDHACRTYDGIIAECEID